MNKQLACAATLLVATMTTLADAQAAGGAYAFGGGGLSQFGADCEGLVDCDKRGSAFRFGAGYRTESGLAAEALILSFGKLTAREPTTGLGIGLKSRAIGVGAAYHLGFTTDLAGVARVGMARVEARADVAGQQLLKESSTRPYAGIGLTYAFTPGIYGEIALDLSKARLEGDSINLRAVTLGFGVRF